MTKSWLFPDRDFIGPLPAVGNYALAAGLLFRRYNDGTRRKLCNYPREEFPVIEIDCVRTEKVSIPITEGVFNYLQSEGAIETIQGNIYGKEHEFRLSKSGKERVVTEWFFGSATIRDFLAAGALVNSNGEAKWTG